MELLVKKQKCNILLLPLNGQKFNVGIEILSQKLTSRLLFQELLLPIQNSSQSMCLETNAARSQT